MRLIDVDVFEVVFFEGKSEEFVEGATYVLEQIDKQPTVEAKPVVHCKDCEHWGTGVAGETEHVKCCEYGKYMVGENGFCCYADMRGGNNE